MDKDIKVMWNNWQWTGHYYRQQKMVKTYGRYREDLSMIMMRWHIYPMHTCRTCHACRINPPWGAECMIKNGKGVSIKSGCWRHQDWEEGPVTLPEGSLIDGPAKR